MMSADLNACLKTAIEQLRTILENDDKRAALTERVRDIVRRYAEAYGDDAPGPGREFRWNTNCEGGRSLDIVVAFVNTNGRWDDAEFPMEFLYNEEALKLDLERICHDRQEADDKTQHEYDLRQLEYLKIQVAELEAKLAAEVRKAT